MTITVGSTFSGIGGFELAALQAGMPTLWSSEINADARSVLCHHFPEAQLHGDIAEIGSANVEPVDLLCGGFPCQDLSVAGKRAGLAGARSGLFYEFARIADEIRPTWVIVENVPGLLSSQRGRDMGIVVGTLGDLGYGVAWRVLDAQNFGVPQRRRRVVIVGHLDNVERAGSVLFEREGGDGDSPSRREPGSVVAALTANGVGTCGADDNQGQAGHLIPVGFDARGTGVSAHEDGSLTLRVNHYSSGAAYQCHGSNVGPMGTLRAGNGNEAGGVPFLPVGFATSGLDSPRDDGMSPPLKANLNGQRTGSGPSAFAALPDLTVRRLTPVECERLQGFPDGWTDVPNAKGKPMADSARYRMLGNAVAVPVFRWVLDRVARVHEGEQP